MRVPSGVLQFAHLGLQLGFTLLGCVALGYYLGGWAGSVTVGVISGAVLGLVAGMYNLIRQVAPSTNRRNGNDRTS